MDWARPVVHWEIEAVVHWEIEAVDAERQRAFYAAMFNWEVGEGPIMDIPAGIGGPEPGPGGHIRQSNRSGVSLYVQVLDLAASLVRVAELGGAAKSDPIDITGGPTIAFAADPEGNSLVFVQQ